MSDQQQQIWDEFAAAAAASDTGVYDTRTPGAFCESAEQAPLAIGASSLADVVIGIADAWRCYEAHRVSAAHTVPDTTNAAAALPPLLELHSAFLRELATNNPTNPTTENEARTVLVAAGFQDV